MIAKKSKNPEKSSNSTKFQKSKNCFLQWFDQWSKSPISDPGGRVVMYMYFRLKNDEHSFLQGSK